VRSSPHILASTPRTIRFLLALLLVMTGIRLLALGAYPLLDLTEARYAEISRVMLATGNWITPQLQPGVPFWGKPPLVFWCTAFSFKLFGINEFAARLPSFLFSWFNLGLVFLLGRKIRGTHFGLLAAVVLGSTGFFFAVSASVIIDTFLAALTTLAMAAFVFTMEEKSDPQRLGWGYVFFASLALGILAKGPIFCILTLTPIFVWIVIFRQGRAVRRNFPLVSGTVLLLVMAVPWFLIAEEKTPGFLNYFIIGEHFKRFLVSGWQGDLYGDAHRQPLGTIWGMAVPAMLPWLIILIAGLGRSWKAGHKIKEVLADRWLTLLVLWVLTPLVFFTLCRNILMTYLFPSLAAFALITAWTLFSAHQREGEQGSRPWFLRNGVLVTFSLMVPLTLLLAGITVMPKVGDKKSQKNLVRAFLAADETGNARLVYTRRLPYSASFYSRGRAQDIPDESSGPIVASVRDEKLDFFAIRKDNLPQFPQEAVDRTREVGRFGNYFLRREKDAP